MYPEKFGLIGEGAQGSVIYVQYRDAQGKWTPAAVKFMDPVHKASVKREVKCLKASQHSNHIPALLSADRAKCDGVHSRFIAMRFVEKVDMDAYFDGLRNLETEASLNIFLNDVTRTSSHIVQGIADMHDADWAHLDLKPANLCMEISNGQTQTFLVDFGSSMHGLNTEPEAKLWSTEAIAAPIGHPHLPRRCNKRAVQADQVWAPRLLQPGLYPDLVVDWHAALHPHCRRVPDPWDHQHG